MPSRLHLVQGDITDQKVGAVVNAANSSLLGGGGVDGAIHRAGGPEILDACRRIRAERYEEGLPPGEAVITTAGDLPADYVIHTVGPVWQGGDHGEEETLAAAYRNSLRVARERSITSIAFPSISTGAYGFPVVRAARIALRTVQQLLENGDDALEEVRFVLFSEDDLSTYRRMLDEISS